MMKKYSVKELAGLLGCSLTAVNKKIKPDPNNPDIKRYRNQYETVVENNVTYILLDDEALEDEKNKSKGFKTVFTNGFKNVSEDTETDDIIDIEPIQQANKQDKLIEFTERYINDFTTMQKTFYDEMREKDKQIYLLTTSENQKQAEYFETQALNKQLKKQNNVLTIALTVAVTLLITLGITFVLFNFAKPQSPEIVEVEEIQNVQETVQQPQPTPPQPTKPVQPKPKTYKPVRK